MIISRNKIYAFIVCIIAGLLFTIIIYNNNFKYLISRNIVITISYCILYLFVCYKFRLSYLSAAFFTFFTPFIIDFSVVFTNIALVPVRFPFATSFLILGIILGFLLQKSIKYKIVGVLFVLSYFLVSWIWIIPYILNRSTEIITQVDENYFSTNLLNEKGDTLKLESLTKKAVIIDFFFVGCPPCDEKRKMLEELKFEIPDERFKILLICDGSITEYKKFQEYAIKNPSKKDFQLLYDYSNNISRFFPEINGYPYELVFNNKKLIKSYNGFDSDAFQYSKKVRYQTINKILND